MIISNKIVALTSVAYTDLQRNNGILEPKHAERKQHKVRKTNCNVCWRTDGMQIYTISQTM